MQVKSETRVRANGALLSKHVGKEVCVVGNVLNSMPDGSSFDIKTSDKHVVTCIPRQPLSETIGGVVEVHGVVRTKDSIVCNYFMAFPDDVAADYDPEIVNELANLINTIPNQWKS